MGTTTARLMEEYIVPHVLQLKQAINFTNLTVIIDIQRCIT
jgi:hypothetical protein